MLALQRTRGQTDDKLPDDDGINYPHAKPHQMTGWQPSLHGEASARGTGGSAGCDSLSRCAPAAQTVYIAVQRQGWRVSRV